MPPLLDEVTNAIRARPRNSLAIEVPGEQQLSYDQLHQVISSSREEIVRAQLGRGDRVACIAPRGPSGWITFLIVSPICTCIPLTSALPIRSLISKCAMLRVAAVLAPQQFVSQHCSHFPDHIALLSLDLVSFEIAVVRPKSRFGQRDLEACEDALLVETSGTTGEAKVVCLSPHNLLSTAMSIAQFFRLTPTDSCGSLVPFNHVHGLITTGLSTLLSGGRLVVFDSCRFTTAESLAGLRDTSWVSGTPSLYELILEAGRRHNCSLQGPRFIRVASASLPKDLRCRLEAAFGCRVIESYGLSETSSLIASQDPNETAEVGSGVGRPVDAQLRIFEPTWNQSLSEQVGEIVVRGEGVCRGYLDGELPKTEDGWFRTGDIGFFDRKGSLFVLGRIKHQIRLGGETIVPSVVEAACSAIWGEATAVAVGVPHAYWGEVPVVALLPRKVRGGHDTGEIDIDPGLFDVLAASNVPVGIICVAELPFTALGKIDRRRLEEQIEEHPVYRTWWADRTLPRTAAEAVLSALLLQATDLTIGIHANYLLTDVSPTALRDWAAAIEMHFDRKGIARTMRRHYTIAKLAETLQRVGEGLQ